MFANRTTTAREVLGVLALCTAFHVAAADEEVMALGQGYTQQFFDGEVDTIWAQMTPDMQDAIGSKAALAAFRRRIEAEAGVEQQVVREAGAHEGGARTYLGHNTL